MRKITLAGHLNAMGEAGKHGWTIETRPKQADFKPIGREYFELIDYVEASVCILLYCYRLSFAVNTACHSWTFILRYEACTIA